MIHADKTATGSDVAFPALSNAGFDCDASRDARRQDAVSIVAWLSLEQLPTGHADDADRMLCRQSFGRLEADVHFATGADQNQLCVGRHSQRT